jgi:hypothetical protein
LSKIVLRICAHALSQPYLSIALILIRYAFGTSDGRYPVVKALCISHHFISLGVPSALQVSQITHEVGRRPSYQCWGL